MRGSNDLNDAYAQSVLTIANEAFRLSASGYNFEAMSSAIPQAMRTASEQRRRVLAYVRQRPEELRPWT